MVAPAYPPPAPGLTRISQSTLREYLRCGIAWAFRREDGNRYATVRMLIGSGVDRGAAADHEAKIHERSPLSVGDIVDVSIAGYEAEVAETEVPAARVEIDQGKDETAAAARAFAVDLSPAIVPIAAQVPMVAALPGRDVELVGTPDLIEEIGLADLKVGRAWSQDAVDRSHQLTAYSLLHRIHFGRWPGNAARPRPGEGFVAKVRIDSIHRVRGGWQAERIWSYRTAEHVSAFLAVVDRAVAGMEAGIALPAPEGAWWCSPAWCPFWHRCPAVGKKKE